MTPSADPLEILVVADEVDEYSSALPGLRLDVVRTGEGYGPNIARSVVFDDVAIGSGIVQFPVLGRTDIGDTDAVFALVTSAPPGSRWCEIDVQPGTLLIYGPGSEHAAVSPAGIGYSFTVVDVRALEEHADELELPVYAAERGRVCVLPSNQRTKPLRRLLSSLRDPLAPAASAPRLLRWPTILSSDVSGMGGGSTAVASSACALSTPTPSAGLPRYPSSAWSRTCRSAGCAPLSPIR
jgi:hypothetical protein